ncbi:hypothetical protein IC229_23895 [Spirosoma sp. BT702]|uniref:Uncharacterized protein n=1 Tax=Spirosoma profusum TaxID=2771354 RepID=A0A927APA6_9BACT|nr:hypothetical protein [Spirosoma profusum]MBD2703709.1 hypothetical protein [Spirosoma profusum]
MKIFVITLLVIIALGYLFVKWANKPENVEALQKKRASEAIQKIEDEKKQAALLIEQAAARKEIERKKGLLKLVIDENFASNRFEKLAFNDGNISYFKFGKNEFEFSGLLTKGQNAQNYFISSSGDFGDFVAETQIAIWGTDCHAGIFWDGQPNGTKNPSRYQVAYSSPNRLYVEAGEEESYNLGGLIASENIQLLRVERFGKILTISVNGRVLFDEFLETAGKGKVGLFIGHRGGIRDNTESISIAIKHFKVWQ